MAGCIVAWVVNSWQNYWSWMKKSLLFVDSCDSIFYVKKMSLGIFRRCVCSIISDCWPLLHLCKDSCMRLLGHTLNSTWFLTWRIIYSENEKGKENRASKVFRISRHAYLWCFQTLSSCLLSYNIHIFVFLTRSNHCPESCPLLLPYLSSPKVAACSHWRQA